MGFGRIEVKNFQSAVAMGEGALFILTRQPRKDLVLPCMALLSELSEPREMGFSSMYAILELVRTVGESEDISAASAINHRDHPPFQYSQYLGYGRVRVFADLICVCQMVESGNYS